MRPIPTEPCLGLIHTFEQGPHGGFASTAYQDASGNWTIGWGHLLPSFTSDVWTEAQADAQAITDLTATATQVCAILANVIDTLTDGQYAACIDFAFNEGAGRFGGSTLAHYINTGALNLVPAQFGLWVYEHVNGVAVREQGLVNRRAAEVQVWNT